MQGLSTRLRTPIPSPSTMGIPQDFIIFAMIMIAFVVYITLKGELRTYMGFFSPMPSSGSTGSNPTGITETPPGSTGTMTDIPVNPGLPGMVSSFFGNFGSAIGSAWQSLPFNQNNNNIGNQPSNPNTGIIGTH